MAKKLNWMAFERTLAQARLKLFSPLELQRVFGISPVAASFLAHRYTRQGALLKLRNGLYCFADRRPPELVIANRLYEPSYVSFEYALAYYHLIPETTYAITSATPRPTRRLTAAGLTFEYHRLKRSAFTGYEPVSLGGDTALLAVPEKAVVDYLYLVDLKEAALNDRLNTRSLGRRRLNAYAKIFNRPSLTRRVRRLR
jgi:predicted transcriptional regulator of viral defense system